MNVVATVACQTAQKTFLLLLIAAMLSAPAPSVARDRSMSNGSPVSRNGGIGNVGSGTGTGMTNETPPDSDAEGSGNGQEALLGAKRVRAINFHTLMQVPKGAVIFGFRPGERAAPAQP